MQKIKAFIDSQGNRTEVERETKILELKKVYNTDTYNGKNHDALEFEDEDGRRYIYNATLNAEMTEYDSKIAKELAFREGERFKISGYFVQCSANDDKKFWINSPRLIKERERSKDQRDM